MRPGRWDAGITSRRFHLQERPLASLRGRKQRLRFCGAQLRPSQFNKLKYAKVPNAAAKLTTNSTNHRWGFLRGSVEKGLGGSKIIAVNAFHSPISERRRRCCRNKRSTSPGVIRSIAHRTSNAAIFCL